MGRRLLDLVQVSIGVILDSHRWNIFGDLKQRWLAVFEHDLLELSLPLPSLPFSPVINLNARRVDHWRASRKRGFCGDDYRSFGLQVEAVLQIGIQFTHCLSIVHRSSEYSHSWLASHISTIHVSCLLHSWRKASLMALAGHSDNTWSHSTSASYRLRLIGQLVCTTPNALLVDVFAVTTPMDEVIEELAF